MAKKTISFTLDESIAKNLEEQAKKEHRNISNLLEHLISCYLERDKIMQRLIEKWTEENVERNKVNEIIDLKAEKGNNELDHNEEDKKEDEKDSILNHIRHNF